MRWAVELDGEIIGYFQKRRRAEAFAAERGGVVRGLRLSEDRRK